jgi:hypothetical protein
VAENGESKIRAESNFYNQGTKSAQLIHEILNSAENWTPIIDKIKSGKARDINDEMKIIGNSGCFILGSGMSLDLNIEYLRDWTGGIFCTPSHALTLRYYGIEPTHILILDPFEQWSDLSGIDWGKTRTKLIAHPGCRPDLIENWPNDILLYLENSGRGDSFYQDEQQKMYSWRTGDFRQSTFNFYIRTGITIFACSPPMEMFAAEILGYDKFFLMGCDFAAHDGKYRFTNYTIKPQEDYSTKEKTIIKEITPNDSLTKPIKWEKHEHLFDSKGPIDPDMILTNNKLYSRQIHLYYLKNFISAWRLSGKTVFTTDHGAMTQVPFHDIKAVIKYQGDFPLQERKVINSICDTYLASTGAYVIETDKGVSFIESTDYETELPKFMSEVMKRYRCDKCKGELNSNDEIIHDDEECPLCKQGKLGRAIIIDVEANMKRIRLRSGKDK